MAEPKPQSMIARDLVGYGEFPPDPKWPGGAKIAVNFNLNVEAGGELTLANGDDSSEGTLNDIGFGPKQGIRVPLVESAFEYGSRRGVWRVLDIFREFKINISVLAVARGLEQVPKLAHAFVERGHEIVSHGYRWIDYCEVAEEIEREHIRRAIYIIENLTWVAPDRLDDRTTRAEHTAVAGGSRRFSL